MHQEVKQTPYVLDLSGTVFPGVTRLGNEVVTVTMPSTLLIGCVFMGPAHLENIRFDGLLHMDDATFKDVAYLHGIRCCDDASFNGCNFGPHALLPTTFERDAYFQGAVFEGNCYGPTSFAGRAWFQNAEFRSYAYFDCSFGGQADFSTDSGQNGRGPLGFSHISFEGSIFHDEANFSNRQFFARTNFKDVIFHVAPEFHGAKLHQDTDFGGAQFLDRGAAQRRIIFDVHPQPVDAARAYRTLKLAMEAVRNSDDEARFFALEQTSLRRSRHVPYSVKFISLLYGLTSNYGRSVARPALLLLANVCTLALTRGIVAATPVLEAANVRPTLLQLVKPFDAMASTTVPSYLAFVGVFHGLLNVVFLSLLVIAIRRRFKIA